MEIINEILINDNKIIKSIKEGKHRFYIDEHGHKHSSIINKFIKIKCIECNSYTKIKYYHALNKKKYICGSCRLTGKRNPFYGKTHKKSFKKWLSRKRKGQKVHAGIKTNYEWWLEKHGQEEADRRKELKRVKMSKAFSGENNPFYGKTHKKSTLKIIKEKTAIWREGLNEQEKEKISIALSNSQKKIYQDNPKKYIESKRKAGLISCKSRIRYQMNEIEKIVNNELKNRGLLFKYSVILGFKQFDFGNKKHRILIEVQGDYWHANPKVYKNNQLNEMQKNNIIKDKEKNEFASKHNMKLFYIWEQDIRQGNFKVLDQIKEIICNLN